MVNQADVLVAAFVKDPHIQGTYYATLVATVFYTPYSRNIFHHLTCVQFSLWSEKRNQSPHSVSQDSFVSLGMLTIDTLA